MKRKNRNLASELMQGLREVKAHLDGKITLRTTRVEAKPEVRMTADDVRRLREHLRLSAAVFALQLRVHARTLEKWEQSKTPIKGTSALLLALVAKYPDTLDRIQSLEE